MAQSGTGRAGLTRAKNSAMAADFKRRDVERTTGRCALCYRVVTIDSRKSRFSHTCRGGRI